jgi:two-component system OmpR family response regulator
MRVLIVDDDPAFCEVAQLALETAGLEVESALSAEAAFGCLEAHPAGFIDVILLDVQMPETSGLDLLAELRERGNEVPVLFVTSLTAVEDRVAGLRLGADDYVTKPVAYEELVARIEGVVSRRLSLPTLHYGDLTIDLARRSARIGDKIIDVSPREYDLLLTLVEAKGDTVTREELLEQIWNIHFEPGTNVVNVHIARLRRKLESCGADIIETVRGQGYRANAPKP